MKVFSILKNNIYSIIFATTILFLIGNAIYNFITKKKGTWSDSYFYIPSFKKEEKNSIITNRNTTNQKSTKDSSGELECRRVLELLFDKPFPKCRPDFLKNEVTGGKYNLELDCFNEELRLAVEYDGIGHHKYTPYFHRNHEAFETQKYRDWMKDQLCKENNVILIRVPYTIKNNDIKNYLIKKLRNI